MNAIIPVPAVVSAVRHLCADTSLLTLKTEPLRPVSSAFLPGQFLELSLPGVGEIPLSYCGSPSSDGSIELCIRHTGHVTTPLKNTQMGDGVGVRGPFGCGFRMSEYTGQDLLLVAGGLGMAPVRSLLLAILKQRETFGRVILLFGAREPGMLIFMDELLQLQKNGTIELLLAVDGPGFGCDNVPDCRVALLPELLDHIAVDPARTCAAVCGPPVMYPYLVSGLRLLGLNDEKIHLSLERRMKCGVGRCGHCAVGPYLCCVDGPVFCNAQLKEIEGVLV